MDSKLKQGRKMENPDYITDIWIQQTRRKVEIKNDPQQ